MKTKIFIANLLVTLAVSSPGMSALAETTNESKVPPMANASMPSSAFDHGVWNTILANNVVAIPGSTQFNYAQIYKHPAQLNAYLKTLSAVNRVDFDSWPKPSQLAFLLNAYNAWTIELVLSDFKNIDSIKDLGNFIQSPWKKAFIPLFGEIVSLDHIEHDLIRGSDRYNDPRIHFAANCASIGCPPLRNEAYQGHKLAQQLDQQARSFLSDQSRNRLKDGDLEISPIFKWYKGDFEKGWNEAYSLDEFLSIYANELKLSKQQAEELTSGDMSIRYLDYDWTLNKVQH